MFVPRSKRAAVLMERRANVLESERANERVGTGPTMGCDDRYLHLCPSMHAAVKHRKGYFAVAEEVYLLLAMECLIRNIRNSTGTWFYGTSLRTKFLRKASS